MSIIRDDAAFRQAIAALPLEKQRMLGARFVRRLAEVSDDYRLKKALECVERGTPPNEAEMLDYYRAARNVEVETYTACGHNVDWRIMTTHYVARAIAACVAPRSTLVEGVDLPAYDAAMAARMAKNCERLARGEPGVCNEMEEQYAILNEFLQQAA